MPVSITRENFPAAFRAMDKAAAEHSLWSYFSRNQQTRFLYNWASENNSEELLETLADWERLAKKLNIPDL